MCDGSGGGRKGDTTRKQEIVTLVVSENTQNSKERH